MAVPWYHRTTIYQIYPRSFYDANGDGIGDLQGMIQKLDYIRDLGFETIWASPFFASPQGDFGYDISDYTEIAPEYGRLTDALQLIEEVHRRGMKIVFDMVLNHTSVEHPWFRESRASRDNPRADWYIWRDRPTNWQSMIGGSGWHFDAQRRQYYWASFLPFQPDLNYRNPVVKQTMLDTVRFWLDRGVDGFRLDVFPVIYKDAEFRNNPFAFKLLPTEDDFSSFFQQSKYTAHLEETFAFAEDLRIVCNEYGVKLLLGEVAGNRSTIRRYLGADENTGLTHVFDFGMLNFKFSADFFRELVTDIEAKFRDPFMPVYVFSNHDKPRSIYRLGSDERKAKLLHLFQLTVRGVPCMYYGEELGMTNLRLPARTALDPIAHRYRFVPGWLLDRLSIQTNRDEVRTPMQWNGMKHAGFSSADRTWLSVHANYRTVNVELEEGQPGSLLNTIRALLRIRNAERALQEGSLEWIAPLPEGVLGYARKLGVEKSVILMNFSEQRKEFQMETVHPLFRLSAGDAVKEQTIRLDGFGGMILKKA